MPGVGEQPRLLTNAYNLLGASFEQRSLLRHRRDRSQYQFSPTRPGAAVFDIESDSPIATKAAEFFEAEAWSGVLVYTTT